MYLIICLCVQVCTGICILRPEKDALSPFLCPILSYSALHLWHSIASKLEGANKLSDSFLYLKYCGYMHMQQSLTFDTSSGDPNTGPYAYSGRVLTHWATYTTPRFSSHTIHPNQFPLPPLFLTLPTSALPQIHCLYPL